ncbi:MAG: putative metal-dependent hydrolase [Rhodothermales bacterium]|nr:putative metal-dependent hydrolase [Rhodothermales bacterium]
MSDLRYPIGKFLHDPVANLEEVAAWIDQIDALPGDLRAVVTGLRDDQLDTRYRPEGWTLRQVIHHLGDSHMNSIVRFKLALTEENPTIRPYDEKGWAEQADYRAFPPAHGLDFLQLLHERWAILLRSLSPADLARTYVHPVSGIKRLDWTVGMYAWHGRHHLAHILGTIEREGW